MEYQYWRSPPYSRGPSPWRDSRIFSVDEFLPDVEEDPQFFCLE